MGEADRRMELLEGALAQTGSIIEAIRSDQAELSTPCSEWDVEALVIHLIGQDLRNFVAGARGLPVDWQAPPEEIGGEWSAAYERRANELTDAWRQVDLDQKLSVPGMGEVPITLRLDQHIADIVMHGWDLAKATGQQPDLEPALAEHALDWARTMLRPEHRGEDKAFGPEVEVPQDAPAYDRLAGWFGRDPAWHPSP